MRLTIFQRLLMGYLAIFLLVIALSFYVVIKIGHFNKVTQSVVSTNNRIVEQAGKLTDMILSQIRYERKFLISKDEAFFAQFQKLQGDANRCFVEMEVMADSEEIRGFLDKARASYQNYQSLFMQELQYLKAGQTYSQQRYQQEKETTTNELMEQLESLTSHVNRNTDEKIRDLFEAGTVARQMVLLMTGIFLVLCLIVSYLIHRSITRPISVLERKTGEIARGLFRGDLTLSSPPEIGKLANAFNLMCNKLNELDKIKADFFSSVSHEFRTPLSTIKMGLGLLMDEAEGPITDTQRKLLHILGEETNRLTGLVNALLDLSKMEAGMMMYAFEQKDLLPLIGKVTKEMEPLVEARKIHLEAKMADRLPQVKMDSERMLQALRNLIGNAVKFTPDGGRVSVAARPTGQGVEVSVSDTGPGIPRENLKTIFEKFQQGTLKGPPQMKGTGLGLAITKQIITSHGGKIWAESKPGQGSTFIFLLPA
jgi:two-component system sensor histidine kinase GlrK